MINSFACGMLSLSFLWLILPTTFAAGTWNFGRSARCKLTLFGCCCDSEDISIWLRLQFYHCSPFISGKMVCVRQQVVNMEIVFQKKRVFRGVELLAVHALKVLAHVVYVRWISCIFFGIFFFNSFYLISYEFVRWYRGRKWNLFCEPKSSESLRRHRQLPIDGDETKSKHLSDSSWLWSIFNCRTRTVESYLQYWSVSRVWRQSDANYLRHIDWRTQ